MLVFKYKKQSNSYHHLSSNPPTKKACTFHQSIERDLLAKNKNLYYHDQQKKWDSLPRSIIKTRAINAQILQNKRITYNPCAKTQEAQASLVSVTTGLQVRKVKRSTHQFTSHYKRDQILHFFDSNPVPKIMSKNKKTEIKIDPSSLNRNKYKKAKIIHKNTYELDWEQKSLGEDLAHRDLQSNLSGWGAQQSQQFTTNIYTVGDQSGEEVKLNPRLPSINLGFTSEEDSHQQTEVVEMSKGSKNSRSEQQDQNVFIAKQSIQLVAPSEYSDHSPLSISIKQDLNIQTPLKQHSYNVQSQNNIKCALSKMSNKRLTQKSIRIREEHFNQNIPSSANNIEVNIIKIEETDSYKLSRLSQKKKDQQIKMLDEADQKENIKSNQMNKQNEPQVSQSMSAEDSFPKIQTLNSHIDSKQVIPPDRRQYSVSIRQESFLTTQGWGVESIPVQNRESLNQQLFISNILSDFKRTCMITNNNAFDESGSSLELSNSLRPSFKRKMVYQNFIDMTLQQSKVVQQQTDQFFRSLQLGMPIALSEHKKTNPSQHNIISQL